MGKKRVGHAEIVIGGSTIMLSDEFPDMGVLGPRALSGTPVVMTIYVQNVDKTVALAKRARARILQAAADQFYGDRTARIEDPFGHVWSIQSRQEDVTPRQMQKRLDAMMAAPPAEKNGAVANLSAPAPHTAAAYDCRSAGTAERQVAAPLSPLAADRLSSGRQKYCTMLAAAGSHRAEYLGNRGRRR